MLSDYCSLKDVLCSVTKLERAMASSDAHGQPGDQVMERAVGRSRQDEALSCTSWAVILWAVLSSHSRSKEICCHLPPASLSCLGSQQITWTKRSTLVTQKGLALTTLCFPQGVHASPGLFWQSFNVPSAPCATTVSVPISWTQSAPSGSASSRRDAEHVLWNMPQYTLISRDIWEFALEMRFWSELKQEPRRTPVTVNSW